MSKKRMGLGRGLGALLSDNNEESIVVSQNLDTKEEFNEIFIENIETNPFQPRTSFDPVSLNELKESIQTQGIIQPITVRRISGGYQLISGERRLQASKLAGLTSIPAYIIEATDTQMLEMGLIENIQRENLNPIEVALAYQRLITDCNLKHEELGGRVGKDRSTVNNYLRLLNLPSQVQDGVKEKKISMGHARALLGLPSQELMIKVFGDVVAQELSVRKVEEIVRNYSADSKPKQKKTSAAEPKQIIFPLQESLSQYFGKKVAVTANDKSKGEIKIPFASKIELEEILDKLKK
ncbi:ParB/RepB/Spo0J family partition protein [Lacihabitans lacunae]|uniref:ParB/RepB/Spo0J family partition protein n=1 Tax=Lacihabitans lacunae TaxID=1028214 RepID=A0ABV7YVE1_9BACT